MKLLTFLSLFLVVLSSSATITHTCATEVDHANLGFDFERLKSIDGQVAREIEKGNMPGCVVMVGRQDGIAFAKAYGHRQIEPTKEAMTLDTVFDMASVTKPVATATSIMLLVERGQVRLGDPVATYIPEFAQNGKESITIEHLLTHQSGLIPDNPLDDYDHGADEAWKRIWALKPTAPVGTKFIYSDVGFITLGEVVRRVTGQNVNEFAATNIFEPLGMTETGFLPDQELRARSATTEKVDGQWLKGKVHDPRASRLGGVAGHAGLFSTAGDLAKYAQMVLHQGNVAGKQIVGANTLAEMRRPRHIDGNLRALGWDNRSKYSSNRGELLSASAIGHGGFTGTGFWLDPDLDLFVIFLSTRLHPDGVGNVNPLIGRIGSIAAAALQTATPEATKQKNNGEALGEPALLGIDVLEREGFSALKGRRVGLITNHTGLNSTGERTIDLLHKAKGVELVAIFSPEHGLQGKLDVSHIADSRDEATGLPVHSLYGESRKPTAKTLEGIDTLVYDIQDIGCRFYTYESTMGLALEAAAENKLKFVVLDRPNPLGGAICEGPVLDADKKSFVGHHTTPVRHGMTVGELAKMFAKENKLDVDLEIVKVQNWSRDQYWDATSLVWTNQSPNMRSLTEAVLYPGIGLLETTNVSVGRGTDTPFEVIGAPWIDGVKLARRLNEQRLSGVTFVPIRFTPNASKFEGEACEGVNIIITDRAEFRSLPVGFALALALRELFPDGWETDGYNRLLSSDKVLKAIKAGAPLATIEELYLPELSEFEQRRKEFLIYP
jgi:uncharacterized protein YbbC (DUF1343 family)/CubicO group peptidase (beta-lactamase class C family)